MRSAKSKSRPLACRVLRTDHNVKGADHGVVVFGIGDRATSPSNARSLAPPVVDRYHRGQAGGRPQLVADIGSTPDGSAYGRLEVAVRALIVLRGMGG
jgi:hypothetical protein